MAIGLFVLLLIILTTAQNTYRYTYTALPVSTQMRPSYSLGYLSSNDNISISVQVPSPTGVSPFYFNIQIMTAANQPIVPLTTYYVTPPASVQWRVPASSSYRVEVTTNEPFMSVVMFYLILSKNGAPFSKIVDVLRYDVFKYIYLSQPSNKLIVTTSKGTAYVSPMNSNNQFLLNGTLPAQPTFPLGGAVYEYRALPAGYYGITLITTALTGTNTVTFTSEGYPCPFFPGFIDINSVFAGCTQDTIQGNNILPCIRQDPDSKECLACLDGYRLVGGKCQVNNQCGERQFIHFGVCYDVSPQCDAFEPFTGACQSCLRSTFIVVNGQCVPADNSSQSECPEGKHFYQAYCIPDSCAKAQINDFCTECISHSFQLNANGTCTPIQCSLGFYYSVEKKGCELVPYQCSNFSIAIQSCLSCFSPFFLNTTDKTCVQPAGSKNCQVWNFTSNRCIMCDGGYVWELNNCVLSGATQGPCASGSVLVADRCIVLPAHCTSLNIFYLCDKCQLGYTFNVGQCKKCNGPDPQYPCTCPVNYIMNTVGNCIRKNDYCLYVNQDNGQCLSCLSGDSPVNGMCCASGLKIEGGVCVTPGGQIRLSPATNFALYYKNCDWYSPAEMVCKRCVGNKEMDYDDHCP